MITADMKLRIVQLFRGLVVLNLLSGIVAVPNLRGVAPQDEKYYQSVIIKCKDGSKSFTQERLNDDFCDCVDGTDEPGTNACPEAKFYCKNLGHRPQELFSSRVNDGICDCCDGSDEFDGKVTCSNTCREFGKDANEKLKKKLATFKEGSITRNKDVDSAQKLHQKHEEDLKQLKGEETTLKDVVGKLKVEKEAIEKAEKLEEERKIKEEQVRREKEKEKEKDIEAAKEEPTKAEGEGMAAEERDTQKAEESKRSNDASTQAEIPPESPVQGLDHLSETDRAKVVASRWTGEDVSDILGKNTPDTDPHVDDEDEEIEDTTLPDAHEDDDDYIEPHVSEPDETYFDQEDSFASADSFGGSSSWWSRLLIAPTYIKSLLGFNRQPVDKSEADRIRKEYLESSSKLQDIQSKITELENRLKHDFGKDLEFYGFYDRCFELKENKYTYKVCPFKEATQVESYSTTRLGRWQGFKEDYKEMIFQNGDKCWNGPERGLRVKMRCGTKLELRAIDEPSRCEYVGEFSTPALCLKSKVQALEEQLSLKGSGVFVSHDEL